MTNEHSYFPIQIEWQDTKEKVWINHPDDIEGYRSFKVVYTQPNPNKEDNQ